MAGEVLSQSEIDALLSAISTGEMDADELKKEEAERKVKVYDFKRALRFSKDQIRSLTRIHENFARLLTTYYSAQLRTYTQITVASVDQLPYEEFIRSVPKMTVLNVFELNPLEGRVLMEINPNIAYAMMDRVMGGIGSSYNKIDNLTEIEQNIMSGLFEKSLENYQEAWNTIVDVEANMTDFEVNPQFLQMVSPNETIVLISFNTQIGEVSGMINLCIPHVVLEPIIPKLSVHYWMQSERKEPKQAEMEALQKQIRLAQLPIIAELGASEISIQDFLHLQKGDVIQLDRTIDQPLVVKIGDRQKFTGQPGRMNKKIAVQIIDQLVRGDEDGE
ncbi:flagellar motor switch protein FliM [Metabacillus fastidiosus]|uniref:Flagellar motor switch protein FliM n=1 Tax=Metabacillus fastidiosus TaxID=1458 RepID=A0ABU6NYR9_9BACI|nr:flagellar motor switch protein FliM [Metabacillus fastidiosus]MEC2076970.1 flagellar motor switch protein FliM [Metabacillus fastidiosus]MED4401522.1 flagellar motor switch protein FliM [Metabacillus fastidiosus]MED4452909.1 flagellar motor switch protein FliM [Metabacillus fastidiosus]MED4463156.1 flagellar motor switch protein FliM [Metabacillus fastidiosus]MED4532507.1 flagellar motor switch protein FliM [Metabacillus fastidiosus]